MNSNLKIIEIEARSIDEARERLQTQLTEGLTIIYEEILSGEHAETIQESGKTTEDAFSKALAKVPAQATVEAKKVIDEPKRKSFQIQAENDQEAITKIPTENKYSIDSVTLVEKGSKGFLGIGKRLNTYNVNVFKKSLVNVNYREKVKMRAKIGTYSDKINHEREEISSILEKNEKGKTNRLSQMSDEALNLVYEAAISGKPSLSKSAIELLCDTKDSRAGEVLKKLLLPGQNKSIRQEIFSKFTPSYRYADVPLPLGLKGCEELAIKYLNDSDVSFYAAQYLARHPSNDALPAIIDLIKHSNRSVPTELVTTLGNSIRGSNDYEIKGSIANDIYKCLKILASRGDNEAKACLELTERNLW